MDQSNKRTSYTKAVFKFQHGEDPEGDLVISVWNLISEVIQLDL